MYILVNFWLFIKWC